MDTAPAQQATATRRRRRIDALQNAGTRNGTGRVRRDASRRADGENQPKVGKVVGIHHLGRQVLVIWPWKSASLSLEGVMSSVNSRRGHARYANGFHVLARR